MIKKYVSLNNFIYDLFTNDIDLETLFEQQLLLAEHGISITESENLSDFEREIYVNLIIKKIKNKKSQKKFA